MTEIGMLFNGPMVRQVRRGLKTNTRRAIKPRCRYRWLDKAAGTMINNGGHKMHVTEIPTKLAPGATIWMRETWGFNPDFPGIIGQVCYRADPGHEHDGIVWKPSLHMPKAACRQKLVVTRVSIERVIDITEADAMAEGIERYQGPLRWVRFLDAITGEAKHSSARDAFLALYEHINGPESLDDWVRSIHFLPKEPIRG